MNEDLNRLKIVLAEHKKTNKWLADQLKRTRLPFQSGVPTIHSRRWRLLGTSLIFLK